MLIIMGGFLTGKSWHEKGYYRGTVKDVKVCRRESTDCTFDTFAHKLKDGTDAHIHVSINVNPELATEIQFTSYGGDLYVDESVKVGDTVYLHEGAYFYGWFPYFTYDKGIRPAQKEPGGLDAENRKKEIEYIKTLPNGSAILEELNL